MVSSPLAAAPAVSQRHMGFVMISAKRFGSRQQGRKPLRRLWGQGKATGVVLHQLGRDQRAMKIEGDSFAPKEVAVDPKTFDGLVGRYQLLPTVVLTVTRQEGRFFAQLTGQPALEIFASSRDQPPTFGAEPRQPGPGRPGPQHAVVQHQIDARPRHPHGQPSQKLNGVKHEVRRPIPPRLPELQPHLTLAGQVKPLLRHRRTQRIATHALEPIPLPSRQARRVSGETIAGEERPRPKSNRLHPIANCRTSMRRA
jgi:hypothetical protein